MRVAAIAAMALVLASCAPQRDAFTPGTIAVATTISVLNSFVTAVGGTHVSVRSIVPVGASPETYQPTPQDVALVTQAQLLVQNGAGLETWLARTLRNAASPSLRVVDCTASQRVERSNPHLWMDPVRAKAYVDAIADALVGIDPAHAAEYRANAAAYRTKLDTLTHEIAGKIATIPRERRSMIVFHNAWQYYNDRFGVTTLGFIEANPGQDPNPQQLSSLVDRARRSGVHAIFGEPEYSAKLAQQIASGAGINVVDDVYDDSIGTDPKVREYLGMLRYDTDVIVEALR